ncbi:restriction endonuclease subunit S [Candidatus Spongiihabitans sp.]|uniref:restriction endonuclease subunit S n=1 Tax=Candidatus Spongiihabitans sp. TaxID=3101308 RepID=UPI003C7C0DDE
MKTLNTMSARWKKTKIGQFLFEREGKYRPDDEIVTGIKRIDKIDFSGNFHIATKPSKTNMILVKPGDFVISGINVSKGAMGIYTGKENITATIHYSSYTFDIEQINVEYFKRFLKSLEFVRLLQEQVKGGIKTEIKPKHILQIEIDLPDIEEQQRIVSYFQNIETEDKELQEEIGHQQTLLKNLRQQILQEAIEGKLTAEWRQQNPDVEPANELLSRIQAEKEQLIKDKKIKKQKPLPPISDEEKPFDLPDGWVWCRLGDAGLINPRNNADDKNIAGFSPMPYVNHKFGIHPRFQTREWGEIKKGFTHFAENDIIIAKITPCFENSKAGIIQNIPGSIGAGTTELHVVRVNIDDILPEYVYILVKIESFLINGKKLMKGAVGQKRVPKEYIEKLIIPLPPLPEQKAVATKVEKLLTLCDQMETQITVSQTYAKQLMQAVLKEAFSQNSAESKQTAM